MKIDFNQPLDQKEKEALVTFFNNSENKDTLWEKDTTYILPNGQEISFSHPIVKRRKKEEKTGFRYEVFNPRHFKYGGQASIHSTIGTLVIEPQCFDFKQKKRVIKINDSVKHQTEALNEYNCALESSQLHIKPPTQLNGASYITMRFIKGSTIRDFVYYNKDSLTLAQRICLTQTLLKAYKSQVADKFLIHNDLHPGNIMVSQRKDEMEFKVKIIDFGQSQKEIPSKHPKDENKEDIRRLGSATITTVWPEDKQNELAEHDKKIITYLIDQMTLRDKSKRVCIEEAIQIASYLNDMEPLNNYLKSIQNRESISGSFLGGNSKKRKDEAAHGLMRYAKGEEPHESWETFYNNYQHELTQSKLGVIFSQLEAMSIVSKPCWEQYGKQKVSVKNNLEAPMPSIEVKVDASKVNQLATEDMAVEPFQPPVVEIERKKELPESQRSIQFFKPKEMPEPLNINLGSVENLIEVDVKHISGRNYAARR